MKVLAHRLAPTYRRGVTWTFAALIGATLMNPAALQAQSGSSLFAVGESSKSSSSKSAAANAPAAKPSSAQSAPARAAASSTKASVPARAGSTAQARGRSANDRRTSTANAARRAPAVSGPLALVGRWQDAECVPVDTASRNAPLFVKRQYQFDDKGRAWQLDATIFADAHCSPGSRMLTYQGEGSVNLTGRSRVADGTWDANFRIVGWKATPTSRDGVMALLNARCGSGDFETGLALDLSRTGCSPLGIQPIAVRSSELELVRIVDGKIFLGSRGFLPADRDQRPAQLSRYGLERAPN